MRAGHRRLRTGLWHYLSRAGLLTLLRAPVTYSRYDAFVNYGDAAAYRRQLKRLRAALEA